MVAGVGYPIGYPIRYMQGGSQSDRGTVRQCGRNSTAVACSIVIVLTDESLPLSIVLLTMTITTTIYINYLYHYLYHYIPLSIYIDSAESVVPTRKVMLRLERERDERPLSNALNLYIIPDWSVKSRGEIPLIMNFQCLTAITSVSPAARNTDCVL